VLDATTGAQLASEPLPGDPGDVQLDASLGWLYVVLTNQDAIASIDIRDPKIVRLTPGLPQVTGIAIDRINHLLYATQLGGDLSILDGHNGMINATLHLSDVGLSGVSMAHDRVYAINTPGRELIALDPSALTVSRRLLGIEPAAVVVGPHSGTVFILASSSNTLARLDGDGFDLGDTVLGDTGGEADQPTPLEPDKLWVRPRMAINSVDETVYVIEPEPGRLALAWPAT
jgi:DNA-binding beta-propeller fold protein YncE